MALAGAAVGQKANGALNIHKDKDAEREHDLQHHCQPWRSAQPCCRERSSAEKIS